MIRASIQLSPKKKVVDLLFLYNFYFGQISSSYMKICILDRQTRIKFSQMSSTVLPLYLHCACRDRHSAGDIHASRSPANLALRECLIRSRALEASHRHPFLLPHACGSSRARAEPSPATAPAISRRSARFPRTPSRSTSPSISSARSRARSSQP